MYCATDTTSTTNILKPENFISKHPSFYSDEHLLLGEVWNQQHHQQPEICHDQIDNKSCVYGVSDLNWNEILEYCPPSSTVLPCNNINTQMSCLEFNDFNNICDDFGLCDWENHLLVDFQNDIPIHAKPLNYKFNNPCCYDNNVQWINTNTAAVSIPCLKEQEVVRTNKVSSYNKSSSLSLDDIQKYFDVPITKAAKELNVGLTVLKKRCRELNIARWPHRKIKSLTSLIDNVKELGLKSEIAMLEEHKRMVLEIPEMELTERTKKLRQACFKANYKKRKLAPAPAPAPAPL